MRMLYPIWVYISLGLNILLLGFVLGGALLHPPFPLPIMAMKVVLDKMPEHGRNLVMQAFKDLKQTHDGMATEMKSVQLSFADAVGAPQLDLDALDKAEELMHSRAQIMMKKGSARMRELLQQLTPEERTIIADHLRTTPPMLPQMP